MKLSLLTIFIIFIYKTYAQSSCGFSLNGYCCESVSGPYPRGYVGNGCIILNNSCNKVKICCQTLDQNGLAYYCGQPQ
jgi:hypothetical protein